MTDNVHQLRPKPSDSEKITINLGFVDLGHIDLMVQEGFYSNRTDFIRTAIRNQLDAMPRSSNSPRPEKVWISVCGITAARILKRRVAPERCWRSMYWALPLSQTMSPPSSPAPLSLRSSCWERCTPVQRSRPLSPTECDDGEIERERSSTRTHSADVIGSEQKVASI